MKLRIKVSSDAMEARLLGVSCQDPSQRISPPEIIKLLGNLGIVRGVLARNIADELNNVIICDLKPMLVARGKPPVEPVNSRIERLYPSFLKGSFVQGKEETIASGYGYSVVKGEPLVRFWKGSPGEDGFNVLGDIVPAREFVEQPPIKTIGIVETVDCGEFIEYRAAENGVVANWNEDQLEVNPELIVDGDVAVNVGNISCLWPVTVACDVTEGYAVQGQARIQILGSVRPGASVRGGGDICIFGGAFGHDTVILSQNGAVEVGRVEYATIEAKGDIIIRNYVVGATLRSGGKIQVQGAGLSDASTTAVRGGVLNAVGGIVVASAGSRLAGRTILAAGFDIKTFEMQLKLNSVYKTIEDEILRLRRSVQKFIGDGNLAEGLAKLPEHRRKHVVSLLKTIAGRNEQKNLLNTKIAALDNMSLGLDETATIRINGVGLPDLVIRIGRRSVLNEHEPVTGATYYFDPDNGRVIRK